MKYCVKSPDGRYLSAKFNGMENIPCLTDNRELAYVYETESLAQTAIVFAGEKFKGLTVHPFNHTTI